MVYNPVFQDHNARFILVFTYQGSWSPVSNLLWALTCVPGKYRARCMCHATACSFFFSCPLH